MTYEIIQPPFSLKFREMSKKELKEYYQWFMDNMGVRLEELTRTVKGTIGFEGWQADFSPASLVALGAWFAGHVETRKKTQAELDELRSKLTFPIEIPEDELTEKTFSLAYDIGIYLSVVFLTHHSSLKWDQLLSNKRHVDYGQPVLVWFGKVPFNPVRMAIVQASGLSDKTFDRNSLKKLYEVWASKIEPS